MIRAIAELKNMPYIGKKIVSINPIISNHKIIFIYNL